MITANEARKNAIDYIESLISEDKELSLKIKTIDELIYESSIKGYSYRNLYIDNGMFLALLLLKGFKIINNDSKGDIHNKYIVSWE